MRTPSPQLLAALAAECKTLAWCVRITRTDDMVLGFTTHDEPLTVDGTAFESTTAFSPSKLESDNSLAVGSADITGILASDSLTDADFSAGLYDRARVDFLLCDWTDLGAGVLHLGRFFIGEVVLTDGQWRATLVDFKELLQKSVGRTIAAECTHTLGNRRCKVSLEAIKVRVVCDGTDGLNWVHSNGLAALPDDWAKYGHLRFVDGPNAGARLDVRGLLGGRAYLWLEPPFPIEAGHAFDLYPGCNRQLATCRDRFSNLLNFGGFPHVPGTDQAGRYPDAPAQG